ncbi:hypothetical protein AM629_16290 [Photorhabdus heterorhabditis]|uniref:Uncharacterized protein n=1 Tax=Photorhabdus heterorhabditis TaxID=880156 RepID=A0ABR5K8T2_9GAMM|nr:hypothetical protein AM629_16290 [Photorhabdus heterorhabditis]
MEVDEAIFTEFAGNIQYHKFRQIHRLQKTHGKKYPGISPITASFTDVIPLFSMSQYFEFSSNFLFLFLVHINLN